MEDTLCINLISRNSTPFVERDLSMKTWRFFMMTLLFIAMVLLAIIYIFPLWHKHVSDEKNDTSLKTRTDYLLLDARELSVHLRDQQNLPCTPGLARLLEHEALIYPHIHGVYLYRHGEIYCSSLREWFTPEDEFVAATHDAEEGHLLWLSGLRTFPGKVFLAYIRGNQNRGLIITIDTYWLRRWFAENGQNGIIIDGKLLTKDLIITDAETVRTKITHPMRSTLFGFSVVSLRSGRGMFLIWPVLVILILALGILTALFICLYREKKFPTARQLEQAILSGEIVPWYQPIMDVARSEVWGVEILARWHHPEKGLLGPDSFIPLAEHSGLLISMTLALLNQVRSDMDALKFRLPENFHVSININATPEMVDALTEALISFHYSFHNYLSIMIELTEGTEVLNESPVIAKLRTLRFEGIGVALDDFGTAFSNIAKIDQLPVNSLKIDRMFIHKLTDSRESQRLVESIIELARNNRLCVVAEGVETAFQSEFLMSRGIKYQQGYYWSKPLPMMDFSRYLIWHKKLPGTFK
ncbi:EAL domain-containing protein [Klebsiella aerogenes]|nr:hypothetical protein AF47_04995 [Klebsiella aerogenes MGH 61]RSW41791.1 EAL domain-containing protein [Klebsiella aerogenes]